MEILTSSVVVTVGNTQYTIWDEFKGSIDPSILSGNKAAYVPATSITSSTDDIDDKELRRIIGRFSTDDVWNESFTQVILLQREGYIIVKYPGTIKVDRVIKRDTKHLPNGPYLIDTASGVFHAVARRFEDPLHAFTGGGVVYDAAAKKYKLLHTTRYLAPSRLYYESNPLKPLLGLRFAVKDVIDIAGLTTSNGSRCWQDVYPPAENSAPFVEQLTNAGAILVGKLNCTQFCDGQDPSQRHRFEQVSPFNPRGDGYQSPSSSSSGSAAAAAGYDWLDFTIGTDTGGSIRHPAGVNGTYGIRPTFSSVESKGMVASGFMDTVGVFARSASMLERAQKAMTSPSLTLAQPRASEVRYKLIYLVRSSDADPDGAPKWFPRPGHPNKNAVHAEQIFESIVSKLEDHLSCKRQILNLDELWSTTHPENMDASLSTATGNIYQRLVYYATANDVIIPFIAKHKADRDGRTPYLEPIFKKRFEYGTSISQQEFDEAIVYFEMFKKWLLHALFASHDDQTVVLIYPQSWGIPNYRDEGKPRPTSIKSSEIFWEGFSSYSLSYVSGCPDVTVPVGQVPYQSRITEHEEWLPISLSFLTQPGNDRILGSLLKELEDARVIRPVQTGAKAYI